MRCHANARLSPIGRRLLVDRIERDGWTVQAAAESAGISERTARKWLARWRADGELGLLDRSSAPQRVGNRTDPQTVAAICALRRLRFSSCELSELLGLPLSTVCAVLKRSGMGKLGRLGLEPARRYEHPARRADPHRRQEARADPRRRRQADHRRRVAQRPPDAHRRRRRAAPAGRLGLRPRRDRRRHPPGLRRSAGRREGRDRRRLPTPRRGVLQAPRLRHQAPAHRQRSPYISIRHAVACRALGIRHLRTRPRRPQTNGKAERFIRTMLDGWAYSGAIYASSAERTKALDGWLWHYNHRRRHQAIGRATPITRLNNLLGTYT